MKILGLRKMLQQPAGTIFSIVPVYGEAYTTDGRNKMYKYLYESLQGNRYLENKSELYVYVTWGLCVNFGIDELKLEDINVLDDIESVFYVYELKDLDLRYNKEIIFKAVQLAKSEEPKDHNLKRAYEMIDGYIEEDSGAEYAIYPMTLDLEINKVYRYGAR